MSDDFWKYHPKMNLKAKVKVIDDLIVRAKELNKSFLDRGKTWPGYDQYLAHLLAQRQKETMQIGRNKK